MNDSAAVAGWVQAGIAFIALVLFIVVERKKLFPSKSNKSSNTTKGGKQVKGSASIQSSEIAEKEDIDIRAGIYSRILVGIIFSITFGNLYLRISSYFQHSFSRDEVAITVIAIPISLIISFIYDFSTSSTKFFFVHWIERLIIVYGYLYIFSTYVFCDRYGEPPYECSFYWWDRAMLLTALFMILVSYPSTLVDWLFESIKETT